MPVRLVSICNALALLTVSGCSIQKRVYRPGYHIGIDNHSRARESKKNETIQDPTASASASLHALPPPQQLLTIDFVDSVRKNQSANETKTEFSGPTKKFIKQLQVRKKLRQTNDSGKATKNRNAAGTAFGIIGVILNIATIVAVIAMYGPMFEFFLLLACIFTLIGLICSLTAIALEHKESTENKKPTTGLILGVLGTVLNGLFFITGILFFALAFTGL